MFNFVFGYVEFLKLILKLVLFDFGLFFVNKFCFVKCFNLALVQGCDACIMLAGYLLLFAGC
ncbi:hypothetical protein BGI36_07615 [Snodgrassella communis]|uniref:Uncharacterized protein n=1 Tax=Snodgrassella alvi TaxID=1196083 RepID=A0A2N9XSA3_9NEIS|nr:hypothetical protein BGI36_07615 [Snodgrassella communis]PIT51509.1 hypothetical protein BHC48_04290 [Snodgrassella communis]